MCVSALRGLLAVGCISGCTASPTATPAAFPPIPTPTFRSVVVGNASTDAVDRYRYEVVEVTPDTLRLRVTCEGIGPPEPVALVFERKALADGTGVISMEQGNDHSPEDGTAVRSVDGSIRTVRFAASTPSFWPSRRLLDQAAAGRIEGLAFGSYPAPMGTLVRNGSQDVTLTVRGSPRTVRADRFTVPESAWPDQGTLLLVREGLDAVPLVVALSRDGGVEAQILALD